MQVQFRALLLGGLLAVMSNLATAQPAPSDSSMPLALNESAYDRTRSGALTHPGQQQLLARVDVSLQTAEQILAGAHGDIDSAIVRVYFLLPLSVTVDLEREVLGRVGRTLEQMVTRGEHPTLSRFPWPFEPVFDPNSRNLLMTEFDAARLRAAIIRDLPGHLASLAVPGSLAVTAVCGVVIGEYDFDAQGFALYGDAIWNDCFNGRNTGAADRRGFGAGTRQYLASVPPLPQFLPVPLDQAEAFRTQVGEYAHLTVPAELAISRVDGRLTGFTTRYQLRAAGAYTLRHPQTGAALYEWPATDLPEVLPQPSDWLSAGGPVQAFGPLELGIDTTLLLRLAVGLPVIETQFDQALSARRGAEYRMAQFAPGYDDGRIADTWGRFFPEQIARANTSLTELVPQFRDWSTARAAVLPNRLILRERGLESLGRDDTNRLFTEGGVVGDIDPGDGGLPLDRRRLVEIGTGVYLELPAFREDYRITLDPGLRESAEAAGTSRQFRRHTLIEIDRAVARGDLVVLTARPLETNVLAVDASRDGAPPIMLGSVSIDTPDRAFGADPSAVAVGPAPLVEGPLGWEGLDLLRTRLAPDTITDATIDVMLARRYHAEKEGLVPGPQFFELFNTLPSGPEARSAFMAWQRSRIDQTTGPLTMRLPGTGAIGVNGDSFWLSSPFHGVGNATGLFRNVGVQPECVRATTDPAPLLEQVRTETDMQAAQHALACATMAMGMRGFVQPMQAQWVSRGGYASFGTPICRDRDTASCRLPRSLPGEAVTDIHQFIRLDRQVDVQQLLDLSQTTITAVEITLEITGAVQTQDLGQLPLHVATAVGSAVMQGEGILAAASAVPEIRSDGPSIVYTGRVHGIRAYGRDLPGGQLDLRLQDLDTLPVAMISDSAAGLQQAAAAQAEAQVVARLDEVTSPSERDVLGIRLGMPFPEAEEIMRAHMDVVYTFVADRSMQAAAAAGPPPAWSAGNLYIDGANREFIALYHEPLAPEFGVLGVMRWAFVGQQSVQPNVLGPALAQRYGQPTHSMNLEQAVSTGFLWSWSDPADTGVCGFVRERPQDDIWRMTDQNAPWRAPLTINRLALPDLRGQGRVNQYLDQPDIQRGWLCPEILSVQGFSLRPSFEMPDDLTHAVVTVFYDEYRALMALRAARNAVPLNSPDADLPDVELEIEF